MSTHSAVPTYIPVGDEFAFGLFHAPGREKRDLGVLIVPPFGWEDLCSYRARRTWAQRLSAGGYPTLRLDLPSTADSAGSPRDPGRLDAWTASVGSSADWLREHAGCTRIAAIGIGLGGVLVVQAAHRGAAIDDLVLWNVPARGKRLVRELRAFARFNAAGVNPDDQLAEAGSSNDRVAQDGALEVGGFLISAETMGDLEGLDLAAESLPLRPGRRVLMLERDGTPVDPRLRDHLAEEGLNPRVAPGSGYGAMMAHPQESLPPDAAIAVVSNWLGEADHPADPNRGGRRGGWISSIEFEVGEELVRESPVLIEQPFGKLSGVLAEPARASDAAFCVVLLNAGALRRTGPGRLWVDLSRHWAARGVPTLRVDLEAIGDSDGIGDPYPIPLLYSNKFVIQIVGILDHLQGMGRPPRFALAGLCSGAYWSFHTALSDPRVTATLLLNPRALFWDTELEGTRSVRLIAKMMRRSSWERVASGEIPTRRAASAVRAAVHSLAHRRVASQAEHARLRDLEVALDRLRDTGCNVSLVFGEREPLYDELMASGLLTRLDRWPNVNVELIPGRDHTLRPLRSQRHAADLLDRALDREIGRDLPKFRST